MNPLDRAKYLVYQYNEDPKKYTDSEAEKIALIAAKTGSKIEVISGSAEYGNMLSSLGKVGAILRYNPGHAK